MRVLDKKKLYNLTNKYWVSYLVHLFIWFGISLNMGTRTNLYDSYDYLNLSPDRFYPKGQFSFFHFSDQLRGYFLPIFSLLIKKISSGLSVSNEAVTLNLNVIIYALITSILFVYIIKSILLKINIFISGIIVLFFMYIFWGQYLAYFLSDIPAMLCVLIAICALLRFPPLIASPIIGLTLAAAVNIRAAYMATLLIISLILIYTIYKQYGKTIKFIIISVISGMLVVIGFSVISIPQLIINRNVSEINSVFPSGSYGAVDYPTNAGSIPVTSNDISFFQLSVGLGMQKYETNDTTAPISSNKYIDEAGMKIVRKHLPLASQKDYLKLFYKEPKTMTSIYLRHFLNGMDIKDDAPYVGSSSIISRYERAILYFTYGSFAAIMFFIFILKRKFAIIKVNLVHILIIAISTIILALPGAIETRFFIFPALFIPIFTVNFIIDHYKAIWNNKKLLIALVAFSTSVTIIYFQYSAWVDTTLI